MRRLITLPTFSVYRLILLGCLGLLLLSMGTITAHAQNSGAISRSFQTTDKDVVQGALVSTKTNDPGGIELANINSANRLAGVVGNASLVELSSGKQNETQVMVSGTAVLLVSDINGAVKPGDKITASPLDGIGMLATSDAQIIGTALSGFNLPSAQSRTIVDKSGKRQTVRVGYISAQLGISYYVAPTSQFVPPFLQSIANSIAGRPVSFMRILFSSLLLLLAFGSIFVLIYTSVRSGIVSLGRNPLAANAIQHGLVGVVVIVLLIAVLSLVGVYLTLRL